MDKTRVVWTTDGVTQTEIDKIEELAKDILMRVQVVNDMFNGKRPTDNLLRSQLNTRLSNINTLFTEFYHRYSGEYRFIYGPIKLQLYMYSTNVGEFHDFIINQLKEMEKTYSYRWFSDFT